MCCVINGDLSSRLAGARGRLMIRLGDAVARLGGAVPEDPGIAELAGLLEEAARTFHDRPGSGAGVELMAGAAHLRAADRLGGLLPAVTLYHLRQCLQWADTAHEA